MDINRPLECYHEPAIDVEHLTRQKEWSERTFGPGPRAFGVVEHIRKELDEIEGNPADLFEWVDVIILALDGAWREGWTPLEIITAIKEKQNINENRKWPDWRQFTNGQAIEHEKEPEIVHIAKGENLALCGAEIGDVCNECKAVEQQLMHGESV